MSNSAPLDLLMNKPMLIENNNVSQQRIRVLLRTWLEAKLPRSRSDQFKNFIEWSNWIPNEIRLPFSLAISYITRQGEGAFYDALSEVIAEVSTPFSDFLANCLVAEDTPEILKKRGAIHTPSWLASRVTKNAYAHWQRLHRSGKQPKVIADFSCGCGAFLLPSQNLFEPSTKIIGFDIDDIAVAYLNLLNWALGYNWTIQREDSLLNSPHIRDLFSHRNHLEESKCNIDIALGNPPYVRSLLLDRGYSDRIRNHYLSTVTGNYDLSVAFIEHALNILSPDGIASYVVTNKFMTSEYGEKICKMLASQARVINIEDFHDSQVFPGYTTYTCVLTFARKPPAKRFSVTRFPQGIIAGRDPGAGETATLPQERLLAHPWDFASGDIHEVLRKLRDPRHPFIGDVFKDIQQGIRTGANDVFIIENSSLQGSLESGLLIPFVGGEQIRSFRIDSSALRLLFPYQVTQNGQVSPVDEQQLIRQYPFSYQYLKGHKAKLQDRSLDRSTPWYGFSRSQNMTFFRKPKLLVREMMPDASFAADFKGEIAFCSGYGLDASNMDEATLKMWTGVFCTPTMEFILRHNGTQLHSGWFRLMKHHLARTRLPSFTAGQAQHAKVLASLLHASPSDVRVLDELDGLVAQCFNLSEEQREVIKKYLADCHSRSLNTTDNQDASVAAISPDSSKITDSASSRYEPVKLEHYNVLHSERFALGKLVTFRPNKKEPIHSWYQYTQGYSALLVSGLIKELNLKPGDKVFDPFSGCGTTLLSCLQQGIDSVGTEISPLMSWVTSVKTRVWDPSILRSSVDKLTKPSVLSVAVPTLSTGVFADYLAKAYSPYILAQIEAISHYIDCLELSDSIKDFLKLGLVSLLEDISQVRKHGSHYRYLLKDENIGLQKLNINVIDPEANIWPKFIDRLNSMIADIAASKFHQPLASSTILNRDARCTGIAEESVSAVITSPPYLNRNNYIAQQKAELAVLNFIASKSEYKALVESTFRSHTEGKLSKDANSDYAEVRKILEAMQLTKQNNPKIPHMISGYFEDMGSTIRELYRITKPGAVCAFVVGNTRWGGVVVPVDHLLLMIAELHGFHAEKILVTRLKGNSPQQMKQFGRIPVRESIVIFRKK